MEMLANTSHTSLMADEEEDPRKILTAEEVGNVIELGGNLAELASSRRSQSEEFWNGGIGLLTFLQLACLEGHSKAASFLLEQNADPNKKVEDDCLPPAFIAAKRRDYPMLKVLIDSKRVNWSTRFIREDSSNNILHLVTYPGYLEKDKCMSFDFVSATRRCLELLVFGGCIGSEEVRKMCNEPNEPDNNTPLHHTTVYPSQEIALVLLLDKKGLEPGMAVESLFAQNKQGVEPATRLAVATLRTVLDSLVNFQGGLMDPDMKIVIDIQPLLPKRKKIENKEGTQREEAFESESLYVRGDSEAVVLELGPILRLYPKHEDLFDHPVVAAAIRAKWTHFKWIGAGMSFLIMNRVGLQVFGFFFVLFSFGGASMPFSSKACMNYTSPDPRLFSIQRSFISTSGYNIFNCYPLYLEELCRILSIVFWICAIVQVLVILASQVWLGQSWSHFRSNLGFMLSTSDTRIYIAIVIILPYVTVVPMSQRPDVAWCRDVCGLLVVLLGMDVCFLLRDHISNRRAAMIHSTEVVTGTLFNFVMVHALLILGFVFAFYIQLHDDITKHYQKVNGFNISQNDTSSNAFSALALAPVKVMAMLTGELDYIGHPFARGMVFSYVVFALFIFMVVIVLMNLATGLAVNDVRHITNASTDRVWFYKAKNISLWEEAAANSCLVPNHLVRFVTFEPETKLVCFPNAGKLREVKTKKKRSSIVVVEKSISNSAMEICLARVAKMDEAYRGNE